MTDRITLIGEIIEKATIYEIKEWASEHLNRFSMETIKSMHKEWGKE
jgi:hypothetical protein